MFEAVGRLTGNLFQAVSSLLKDGGRAVLQAITIEDNAFDEYVREPDFIQRYIFPGGMLPSMPRLEQPVAEAGLRLVEERVRGALRTHARRMAGRFQAAWPELRRASSTTVSSDVGAVPVLL